MTNLPGAQIPFAELALCVDCSNTFSSRDGSCGKCGSAVGWTLLSNTRASELITKQRDLLAVAEGTLRVIGLRRLGPTSLMAQRVVDRLREFREKETPAASTAGVERKENVQ